MGLRYGTTIKYSCGLYFQMDFDMLERVQIGMKIMTFIWDGNLLGANDLLSIG